MALDFNQKTFTKTADKAIIDEGLRAYMLKVYNYMTTGLLLTGLVSYFFGKASVVLNEAGQLVGDFSYEKIKFVTPVMGSTGYSASSVAPHSYTNIGATDEGTEEAYMGVTP